MPEEFPDLLWVVREESDEEDDQPELFTGARDFSALGRFHETRRIACYERRSTSIIENQSRLA